MKFSFCCVIALLLAQTVSAEVQETEIPGVRAELLELRRHADTTRLLLRYQNDGSDEAGTKRFEVDQLALTDMKSKRRYLPIKDAEGRFVAGPIGDAIGGGRIYLKLPSGASGVVWAYFEAIAVGSSISVEVPQMFPFEDVVVSEGAGSVLAATRARSTPFGAAAALVSAKRADQALKVRMRLSAEAGSSVQLRSPYFEYANVYLFDPVGKRRYPLLEDADGKLQASPIRQDMNAFLPDWNSTILMSLSFQAPPDNVGQVDLILPDFLPIQDLLIDGLGGASAGGIAAAGKTLGLEGSLKELQAELKPEEVIIDLAADVLFDFDKSDLKPSAADTLERLLAVVSGLPRTRVGIEGHTDRRGGADYNQALSLRRAESVYRWLVARGVDAGRLAASGAGATQPVRDGDTEADHQANRRVQVRLQGPRD